jgi:hypothetical protein
LLTLKIDASSIFGRESWSGCVEYSFQLLNVSLT